MTIQKRPLYPKSVVSKLGYMRTAHDVHAMLLAIFDDRHNHMKANTIKPAVINWHLGI